jgi:hypothetical protein
LNTLFDRLTGLQDFREREVIGVEMDPQGSPDLMADLVNPDHKVYQE